jgi:hypothetical protein
MSDSSSISIALTVARILEELNIEYLIVGSLASALHGVSRSTLDADLNADIQSGLLNLTYLRESRKNGVADLLTRVFAETPTQ